MATSATKTGNLIGPRYAAVLAVPATSTTGLLEVAFPAGLFTAPPVVTASGVSADGRDIVVTISGDPTRAGCALLVRKSRPLPAVLGALALLAGFDVFQPAVGVKVHVRAEAAI